MANNSKKRKKHFVGEDDMSTLLQRYTPTTVLVLLQEVSEVEDVKIDWNQMVKKTSTGISSAREYQMLWRHLAYRDALLDRLDDSQPLDDDSDLECELDAVPVVSNEASAEATAYVKVLMASGASNDPNGSKVEGPLVISVPKGQKLKAPANLNPNTCTECTNLAFPVWVPKQPLPSNNYNEVLDSNGVNSNLPRRRRKQWSAEEDQELITAVQKHGEGNWANISKAEFKGDRTALQLSQRWAHVKRQGNMHAGNNSQLSEAQLAARHAMSMALGNRPKLNAAQSHIGQRSGMATSRMSQSVPTSQNFAVASSHLGPLAQSKVRVATKRPSTMSYTVPDSVVKATAVAAGARIATFSNAASVSTTPSNNAAHVMPGGPSPKPPMAGSGNSLPSNVHFIRTGLATKSLPSLPTVPASSSHSGGFGGKTLPRPGSAVSNPVLDASSSGNRVSHPSSSPCADVGKTDGYATSSSSSTRRLIAPDNQYDFKCKTTDDLTGGGRSTSEDTTHVDLDARNCSKDHINGSHSVIGES